MSYPPLPALLYSAACDINKWGNGAWWDVLWCEPTAQLGWAGMGFIMVAFFTGSLYVHSQNWNLPAVILALFAAVIIGTLPGTPASVVATLVAVALWLGLLGLWRRASQ